MKNLLVAFGFAALLSLPTVASAGGQSTSSNNGKGSFSSSSMRQNPNGTATPIRVEGGVAQPRAGAVSPNFIMVKPGFEVRTVTSKDGKSYQRAYQKTTNKNGKTVWKEVKVKDAYGTPHVPGPFQPMAQKSGVQATGFSGTAASKPVLTSFNPQTGSFSLNINGVAHFANLNETGNGGAPRGEYTERALGARVPGSPKPVAVSGYKLVQFHGTGEFAVHEVGKGVTVVYKADPKNPGQLTATNKFSAAVVKYIESHPGDEPGVHNPSDPHL